MDINTIAKTAAVVQMTSVVAFVAFVAYSAKKQKQIDKAIYGERSFVRNGVRFTIAEMPSDIPL